MDVAPRPEAEAYPSPLYFFLSYAHSSGVGPRIRFERDALVHRFEEDLGSAVLDRARHPRAIVPGRSDTSIPIGARWPKHLAKVLATCRSFVALYSGEYFDSPECGKEWSAFAERINRDYIRYGEEREAFIPVLWLSIRPESIPPALADMQFSYPDLGPEYHRQGLQYLMTHEDLKEQYHRAVEFFADRVVSTAENNAPTTADPPPVYRDLRNAFAAVDPAESPVMVAEQVKIRIVVAAPRLERLPRGCDPAVYGAQALNWRPYLPDYSGEVAQVAKRLANSLGFSAFIENAERSRELIPTADATAPTVLLVDPWATQLPELRQRLADFDRRTAQKQWIRLVVLWNRANDYSAAAGDVLESELERTLAQTRAGGRRETPRAIDGLETIDDLINELPPVLQLAEQRYLDLTRTHPPSSPSSQPPGKRPRLRAPGLGPGGLRSASPRGDDEPNAPTEDRR